MRVEAGSWVRFGWLILAGLLLFPLSLQAQEGYYRVQQQKGIWWLIAPDGSPWISVGVDAVTWRGDAIHGTGPAPYEQAVDKRYGDRSSWATATLNRLHSWGFNTLGAWSDSALWDHGMAYTINLDIAAHAGADWQHGKPVDVYSSLFPAAARSLAQQLCAGRDRDHDLLGYFSDNELRWGSDWRGHQTMLELYLQMPASAPGHQHAVEFLRLRYQDDIKKLNRAWGIKARDFSQLTTVTARTAAFQSDSDQFLEGVAERYFQVCADAIHAADPNHLYLGARFAGTPPDPVLRAARIADVVSINIYSRDPRPLLRHIEAVTGKPILVGEFAFRGEDAGLPNSKGGGPKVPTQADRAQAYHDFVRDLMSEPAVVGYHWFKWSDEPKEGRFDGEDSNYGLVTIDDDPYATLVRTATVVNGQAVAWHQQAEVAPARSQPSSPPASGPGR